MGLGPTIKQRGHGERCRARFAILIGFGTKPRTPSIVIPFVAISIRRH